MRAVLVFVALLAGAMPAAAQTYGRVDDGDCWATFTVLGQAASRSPAAKAVMDTGAAAARGAIQKLVPEASADELGVVLKSYGSDLMTALKNKSVTQQKLVERANACETQYGLPVTDFAKLQAPAKPE